MGIFTKSGLLGFLKNVAIAGVLLILLLLFSGKYKVTLVNYDQSSPTSDYFYSDLDHDGISEKIHYVKNLSGAEKWEFWYIIQGRRSLINGISEA